ncbi:MAG: hypothetical protein V3W19_15715 [Desulfatiglandales bacterium]
MSSHVPNKGEQMMRYYAYYSNVSRGRRKKANTDELIPTILEPVESLKVERPELTSNAFQLVKLTEREYREALGHLNTGIPYPIFHRNVLMAVERLQQR